VRRSSHFLPRGPVDETLIRHGAHRSQVGDYATVTWLRGDRVVMVASALPADRLDALLALSADGVADAMAAAAPGPGLGADVIAPRA